MANSEHARAFWLVCCLMTAGGAFAQSEEPVDLLKPRLLPVAPAETPEPEPAPVIAELDLQGSDPVAAFKPRLLPIPASAPAD